MEFDQALIIIDRALIDHKIGNIQEKVLQASWDEQTYQQISEKLGYDHDYVRAIGALLWQQLSEALGEKVTKHNFKSVLGRLYRQGSLSKSDLAPREKPNSIDFSKSIKSTETESSPLYGIQQLANSSSQDWEDAPDLFLFYGRNTENDTIRQWILTDHCRLICLFGMGGIGKTAIAVNLAHLVQRKFEYVMWRSLQNAPPLDLLLVNIIQFLSKQQETERSLPIGITSRIRCCLQYLKQKRCLLIFDNVESILQSGQRCGMYRSGYKDYGEFLRQVGEQTHQSCLLVTSREKPQEISLLEGETLPVRSLQLDGLDPDAGRSLIQRKGQFTATPTTWKQLNNFYCGNPLALKIAAAAIQDLFEGDVEAFLRYFTFVFDDISDLLDQQFERLTILEKQVMYWLAIEREPVTIEILQSNILPSISKRQIFESLKSLIRRSLIYKTDRGFTQQPVVMEYVIDLLRNTITNEICSESPHLLIDYALMKSKAKEYIRASQTRIIIEPIKLKLLERLNTREAIEQKLKNVIQILRQEYAYKAGYSIGNIISLLQILNIDISGYDLSNLQIRQTDLQNVSLSNVNLTGAILQDIAIGHNYDYFFSIVIDPTGKFVASGGAEGTISVKHFPSMEPCIELVGHNHWINELIFSPDSQLLASASTDHTVRVWDLSSSQCIIILSDHASPISSANFSPDGEVLITSAYDGTIKFWNTQTWSCLRTIQEKTGPIGAIALSPDGQILVSGSFDGFATLYNLRTLKVTRTTQKHQNLIWCLKFHPSGERFYTGSHDYRVMEWDCNSGQLCQQFTDHIGEISCLSCSQDGKFLASGSHDQTIRLWDIATGQCIRVLQGHQRDVWSIDFCPQGDTLASVSLDYSTKLWEVRTGYTIRTIKGYHTSLWSLAFSRDGSKIISGGEDGQIRIWELSNQKCKLAWKGHESEVTSIATPSSDSLFASGSGDRTVKIWDIESGQCLHTLKGHTDWIWSIAFNPETQHLASVGRNDTICIWDINTGECIQTVMGNHKFFTWSISYSHNGKKFASASYDGTIKLWDTNTWQCISTLIGHQSFINSVCFNPKKDLVGSAGYDKSIKIWDTHTAQCIHSFEGHLGIVWSVAFSPDGDRICSTSTDGTIKIWDVQTGQCLQTLKGHQGVVLSARYHPSKNILASSSRDGTIRVWDLNSETCLMVLNSPKLYEGLRISNVRGISDRQRKMLFSLGAVE